MILQALQKKLQFSSKDLLDPYKFGKYPRKKNLGQLRPLLIGLQPLKNTSRLGSRPISMVGKKTRFETSPATSIFVILLTFGPYLLRVNSW